MNAPARAQASAAPSFAALRHRGFRAYFLTSAAAMMADSIEHVISYWIIFQKFESPALAGFAVVSHWLPFLLFSVYSGALADRFDPRRIIQLGMALFMAVSLGWGLLSSPARSRCGTRCCCWCCTGSPACCGRRPPRC
jgi:MFS family permease